MLSFMCEETEGFVRFAEESFQVYPKDMIEEIIGSEFLPQLKQTMLDRLDPIIELKKIRPKLKDLQKSLEQKKYELEQRKTEELSQFMDSAPSLAEIYTKKLKVGDKREREDYESLEKCSKNYTFRK